jgi:glycosyltransferase involved in cell wall biosynthesis
MQLDEEQVFVTAHHTQPRNIGIQKISKASIIPGANDDTPVLFVACRISKEKGILELPEIVERARRHIPNLEIVVAGSGPAEQQLKEKLPDAVFLGWQDKKQLAALYLGLDLFVFPSRFDTFGNVILEAFVHGMPTVAYNCKGPRDIIQNNKNGYLVEDIVAMSDKIVEYFSSPNTQQNMQQKALQRAAEYQAEPIMQQFLQDMGLQLPIMYNNQRTVA